MYLKGFVGPDKKLAVFRTLVATNRMPLWTRASTKGIGYYAHLYTRMAAGVETDEIERWLDSEFEQPAAEPLARVLNDSPLRREHWQSLIRFTAAQIVRTPAFFLRNLPRWTRNMPVIVNSALNDLELELKATKLGKASPSGPGNEFANYVPVRVTAEARREENVANVQVSTVAGRGFWYFSMRHLLSRTLTALIDQRWSVLNGQQQLPWFTSDDPVLSSSARPDGSIEFDFPFQVGTEIFFPLSRRHLLYTCLGQRPPLRGSELDLDTMVRIRGLIAKHAHRLILASEPDAGVPTLRQRIVDSQQYHNETLRWQNWNLEQATLEHQLWTRETSAQ